MKKKTFLWQFAGFAVTSFLGTLLHFLYEWTGESPLVAIISGVNESTWEHMKLLFFPMLAFSLLESRFFVHREDFWCVNLAGISLGLLLIPVIFYTYNGVFGKSPDWFNIAIFFISAATAYYTQARLFERRCKKCPQKNLCLTLLCVLCAAFVFFTFFTPRLPIFEDPITHSYGING